MREFRLGLESCGFGVNQWMWFGASYPAKQQGLVIQLRQSTNYSKAWFIGNYNPQTQLFLQILRQSIQFSPTPCEDQATFVNVAGNFWRQVREHGPYFLGYASNYSNCYRVVFSSGEVNRAGTTSLHIAPPYIDTSVWIFRLYRATELQLQPLRRRNSNCKSAMSSQPVHNCSVDVGAADPFSARCYYRSAHDRCHIRCPAPNVYHCRSVVITNRNSRANRRRLTFFDHLETADSRLFSSAEKRALLYLGYF